MMAPAALSFATTVASRGAINSCPGTTYPYQPALVTRPFTLVFALMTIGTPHSGPRLSCAPDFTAAASWAAAVASAPAESTWIIARYTRSYRAMRLRYQRVTCVVVYFFAS